MGQSKYKILFIENVGGNYVPLALELSKYFSKTGYFSFQQSPFPKLSLSKIGTGYPQLEKVNDLWSSINDYDIFFFPDIYLSDIANQLRKMGKMVWGASDSEHIEIDRQLFKTLLERVGLPSAPTQFITGTKELRSFLKQKRSNDSYVKISAWRGEMETFGHKNWNYSEIFVDELEHKLGPLAEEAQFIVEEGIDAIVETGYDGYSVQGQFPHKGIYGVEIKDAGYLGTWVDYHKLPDPVQEVNAKFSPIMKVYNHAGFFSSEIRYTKKGESYFTDPTCYSEDTEILTNEGWKFFKDLNKNELVATLNPITKEIEYKKPYDYIDYNFNGELINITNNRGTIDKLVTPNHSTWSYDLNKKELTESRTDELKGKRFIPRTGIWKGEYKEFFELPSYSNKWNSGMNNQIKKEINLKPVKIKMDDWCEFMGWYLSEGSQGSKWSINISQTKYRKEVEDCLKKLPFKYIINEKGFVISNIQLSTYLQQFGLCDKKFIPDYIKSLPKKQIECFLNSFRLGDGSLRKGYKNYYSTSKQMINEITELIFKCGSVACLKERQTKGTNMSVKDGKEYIRNHNSFVINESNKYMDFYFEASGKRSKQYIKKVKYIGKVYDVTVDNHIIYVRRNGKPFWSGNCRAGNPPANVMARMIDNWDDIIPGICNGQMVQPNFIAKYGCEIILKSPYANNNFMPVQFPTEYADNINIKCSFKIGEQVYVIPITDAGFDMEEIGSVVVVGDDVDSIMERALVIAGSVEAYQLKFDGTVLEKAKEEIAKLEKALNIKF